MAQRLAFLADWLDPVSGVNWSYQLFCYAESSEIELVGVPAAGSLKPVVSEAAAAARQGRRAAWRRRWKALASPPG
jgi:hypothetical protein